jgi:hypothetical protein
MIDLRQIKTQEERKMTINYTSRGKTLMSALTDGYIAYRAITEDDEKAQHIAFGLINDLRTTANHETISEPNREYMNTIADRYEDLVLANRYAQRR